MKRFWILISSALLAFPTVVNAAVAVDGVDAFETIEYHGHLTVAGKPFSGKGYFKFALLRKDGARLWTSGDNEAPIEEGVPSGTVTLSVQAGSYHAQLGDPGMGMKQLLKATSTGHQASHVGIWFDDGKHGWSFLGNFELAARPGNTAATTIANAPITGLSEIQAELRSLHAEVADLRQQLSGVKDRLALVASSAPKQPAAKPDGKPATVSLKEVSRHSLGRPDAPLVLVEFTDYECGYCKRFFDDTFPLLKRDYIDTGKLRFVSRNMPAAAHPHAEPSALALLAAAERTDDDYWKMRAWLFANQRSLGPSALSRYASESGLDAATILSDNAARKHRAEIQEDVAAARAAGITGTPSFVLGTSDGQIIRGERIIGSKTLPVFESKIQALLAKGSAPNTVDEPRTP